MLFDLVHDVLAAGAAAIGEGDGVAPHVKKMAAVDLFGIDRRFAQMGVWVGVWMSVGVGGRPRRQHQVS